jgi:hypothetical protein
MKYLVRSSRDTICWCDCSSAMVTPPGMGQMACPWCGCGFLFSCLRCRLAFTFAKCVDMPLTSKQIVREDYRTYFSGKEPDANDVKLLSEHLEAATDTLVLGCEYVVLDGRLLRVDRHGHFIGSYGRHTLDRLPHADHRQDRDALVRSLDRNYWLKAAELRTLS